MGGNPDFSLYVTEKIDLEKLKSYGLPIIIDFGADSCIPCKEMAPVLLELNAGLRGKAKYGRVSQSLRILIGLMMALIAFYLFYLGF